MALVDVDSWPIEYEACERLHNTILTKLQQRDKRQRLSQDYNRLTNEANQHIKQLELELQQLSEKLDGSKASNDLEVDMRSRRRQVSDLESQLRELKSKLGGQSNTESGSSSLYPENRNDMQIYKEQRSKIMEKQNRGLETLEQSIARQRQLAEQLGQEVEDQNDIMDNLANTMERVESGVNAETDRIGYISRRDSTCGYWTVILVLFVAIIIVSII